MTDASELSTMWTGKLSHSYLEEQTKSFWTALRTNEKFIDTSVRESLNSVLQNVPLYEKLVEAVFNDDDATAHEIFTLGEFNIHWVIKNILFMIAVDKQKRRIIALFIQHGVNFTTKIKRQMYKYVTCLSPKLTHSVCFVDCYPARHAVCVDDPEMLEIFLKHSDEDTLKKDALMLVCLNTSLVKCLDFLLDNNLEKEVVDNTNIHGATPLSLLLRQRPGKPEIVEKLLDIGVNVNKSTQSSAPPIILAAKYNAHLIPMLLRHGAMVDACGRWNESCNDLRCDMVTGNALHIVCFRWVLMHPTIDLMNITRSLVEAGIFASSQMAIKKYRYTQKVTALSILCKDLHSMLDYVPWCPNIVDQSTSTIFYLSSKATPQDNLTSLHLLFYNFPSLIRGIVSCARSFGYESHPELIHYTKSVREIISELLFRGCHADTEEDNRPNLRQLVDTIVDVIKPSTSTLKDLPWLRECMIGIFHSLVMYAETLDSDQIPQKIFKYLLADPTTYSQFLGTICDFLQPDMQYSLLTNLIHMVKNDNEVDHGTKSKVQVILNGYHENAFALDVFTKWQILESMGGRNWRTMHRINQLHLPTVLKEYIKGSEMPFI